MVIFMKNCLVTSVLHFDVSTVDEEVVLLQEEHAVVSNSESNVDVDGLEFFALLLNLTLWHMFINHHEFVIHW